MERRVLVTGATGFVGRALAPVLAEHGWRVRAAVRRPDAPPVAGAAESVAVGDVGPATDWSAALEGVEAVVHLAARAHRTEERGRGDDAAYREVNARGTERLARAAAEAPGVRRLLFVSSIAAADPADAYGRSKQGAEAALARLLAPPVLPDWTVLRPPLVYGPGNPGNMARLLRAVQSGIPLPLGALRNRRSFLYVGNLADAIHHLLRHPGAARRVFAVSDGEPVSTPDLVRRIARHAGAPARLLPVPLPLLRALAAAGETAAGWAGRRFPLDRYALDRLAGSLVLDGAPLRQATGWTPPFTLDQGLARTLGGAEAA